MERYSFVEGPKTVQEFDLQRGMAFRHGYFKGNVIDNLHVYTNGMFAEGKHDTKVSDDFLDDLEQWAGEALGLVLADQSGGRIYMSQLVVEMAVDLTAVLAPVQNLAKQISAMLNSAADMPAEVSGFHITTDPAAGAGWVYRLERRAGVAFDANLYFSSAPLRTDNHIMLLERMERALTSSNAWPPPS